MTRPTVSVVIPTRDRWAFARRAVAAASAQEGVDVEVIVVDDGSAEGGREQLANLGDDRVRLVRNQASAGVAVARNRGIDEARGDWVALLDDDDLWAPRKLEAQLAVAAAAGADWAYCASLVVDRDRRPLRLSIDPPDPATVATELLRRNVIPAGSSNVVARAETLRGIGRFDERLHQLADWDCWLRLAVAAPAAVAPEVLVAYTEHPGNMLLTDAGQVMRELDYIAEKHRERSREAGLQFDRLAACRWIAWAQRRAGLRRQAVATYLRGAVVHRSPGNVVRAVAAGVSERLMKDPAPVSAPPTAPEWLARFG
jgi:glycosyltransferase involved in cell wall biosynthesis